MEIKPIAFFRSPFTSKFGIPRQSGIAEEVEGKIVFTKPYDSIDAVRGLEGFSHLWIIWEFSANRRKGKDEGEENDAKERNSLTVRPPRLGGNERVGVFASRSPFRPNALGLSCVRIKKVEPGTVTVLGADLLDGTPIYDIKPYIAYTDCHGDARCGFTDSRQWNTVDVVFPPSLKTPFSDSEVRSIVSALEQDPRPHYHHDADRIYAMPFKGYDIRFRIDNGTATVTEVEKITKTQQPQR